MTMHLAQGLTTIRNRKYKPKMTKANIAKWEEGLRIKNKEHKRMGLPKWTFFFFFLNSMLITVMEYNLK